MESRFLPVEGLDARTHGMVLDYPRGDAGVASRRIARLRKMGVRSVSFAGSTRVGGLDILGKGHAGVVVLARAANGAVALKIRRADSARPTMAAEAGYLRAANKVGVGPRLIQHDDEMIVMEYLEGTGIGRWVSGEAVGAAHLKRVVRRVLEDCFRLDCIGLDHGELVDITRHVIVGRGATLIDFESSSMKRRPANVTSAAQSLYVGAALASRIAGIYDAPGPAPVIEALRAYKRSPAPESFRVLLRVLGV